LTVVAYTRLVSSNGLSELRLLSCLQPDCSTYSVKVLASGASQGYHPSLAFQSSGFPMISCSQPNASVSLFLCNDTACSSFIVNQFLLPSSASSPGWTSVALVDKIPTVAFAANDGASSSAVFVWQSGSVNVVFRGTAPNQMQWGSDRNLAVSKSNLPILAFYVDGTGLALALCTDSACAGIVLTPVVDDASFSLDVGLYPSVAAHPQSGFAVVAYHDATNLQLKFVICQDAFCATRVRRQFPSTFGWDPSVRVDPRSGFPVVAFSDPSSSNIVLMACSNADCANASFSGLFTGMNLVPGRRLETVKLVSSTPIIVVAHDSFSSNMIFVVPADANIECNSSSTINCTGSVTVVITTPTTSPFATTQSQVFIRGYLTPSPANTHVVVNSLTPLTLNSTSGEFFGTINLAPDSNFLTVTALDSANKSVGAASLIVFSDLDGPKISITVPSNNTGTVAASILVEGFASASSGVIAVVVLNVATGASLQTNSTFPTWSTVVALAPLAANTIIATATDNLGRTASAAVVVIQQGLTAQLTCPRDFSLECGVPIPSPPLRVLNCAEAAVKTESSQPTCGGASILTRLFTACSVSCSYRIVIVDTTPPSIVCPSNATLFCSDQLPSAVATDSCQGSVQVQVQPAQLACGSIASRIFTSSDGCGNVASCASSVVFVPVPATTTTAVPTTPTAALSDQAIGGLVAGIVLLLLILLLAFLVALCWLRKRKKEASTFAAPIMMTGIEFDDEMSSSTSTITKSKLYKKPMHQSEDSSDFRDVM
jgi:hypothetical protein